MHRLRTILLFSVVFVPIALLLRYDISQGVKQPNVYPLSIHEENTHKEQPRKRQESAYVPHPIILATEKQPTITQDRSYAYDPRTDTLYRAYLWATILGVLVALFGLRYLVKSANAAERAAEAAKKSADGIISVERAWIFASLAYPSRAISLTYHVSNGVPGFGVAIDLICMNEGKTPAWIIEKRIGMELFQVIPKTPPLELCEFQQVEPEALGASKFSRLENLYFTHPGQLGPGRNMRAFWMYQIQRYVQ